MSSSLILASNSPIRAQLLGNAGVPFSVETARVDEDALRQGMAADDLSPREMADHLAEFKAMRVAGRNRASLVLGCDQVLDLDGVALSKPATKADAESQLSALSGRTHDLYSAVVMFEGGVPIWRHIGRARMTMRALSPTYVSSYVARNWDDVRHCVGCYQLEGEGARLFTRIDGDFFTVLGLPLLALLDHLVTMGVIEA